MIEITPATIALAAAAFLIGLLIGRILWGSAVATRDRLRVDLADERRRTATLTDGAAQHGRDLASARDQVKPLAEEVDRLRRENSRLSARLGTSSVMEAQAEGAGRALPLSAADQASDLDDLRLLKGVGDKLAARLNELGVSGNAELSRLSPADAQGLDQQLGPFAGRIARDHLLDQASLLAGGHVTEFEARYGRIERSAG